ncbi:MAG: helix-turn-helix domain-containing protein, partial [Pseudomonadota bacterium]|nr:helix-turn-helix domain-containing protein [Pseudomonadota bacterium]
FRVYTLSIAESILEKSPARERLPALDTDGGAVLECSPGAVSNLRELLAPVLNPAMPLNGTGLNGLLSTVQESLPHLIGEAVTGGGKRKPVRLTRSTRQSVIARVTGHVRDNDDAPASVGGLSRELGISERTLHRALKDHFGVGPKEYLRALRLNRVRRELRRADPGASQVREIALRFGFWHASQFAADYWRLFGELPSETLARRA